MKKLLLLALIGLGLGGGVWKAQNPEGTLDDLKLQAQSSVERLKSGVSTVVNYPDAVDEQASIDERLSQIEQALDNSDDDAQAAQWQAMLDETLAENANSLSSLRESLNDRVAPMEAMTAAVAELDTALQDTRARTDADVVRLDAIDRRLGLLVRRLDEQTTDTELEGMNESLGAVQTRLTELQSRFEESQSLLDENLAGLAERSGNLSARITTLASASSAQTLANNQSDNQADNQGSDDESTSDSAQLSGNGAVLALSASMDERLSGIEERLQTVNSDSRRIAALNEQLAEAQARITELEQQDAQAKQSLEQLSSSVDELTTVGESLSIENIQAQIRDELALAQTQIESPVTGADTTELEALLDTTRSRIQTLEQRVQELPPSSEEADDALETQNVLQTQIADLERRLASLASSDPELQNVVNDVKEQVEQLSSKGFVTQDELRAQDRPAPIEYKIYFDRNSADVTEDASKVLDSFIAQEKNRTTGVSIFGFTDRSGSAAYNQQLALQRATNVRSYLIQNGLDFTKIKALSGLGEDAAAAILPDESFDATQRVVVLFAEQP